MKSTSFLILGALAAGLLAAGCGSDSKDNKQSFGASVGSASTASVSKADFVSQANAICDASNQQLDRAVKALGQNPTPEEVNSFVSDSLVPSISGEVADIRALGAPAGEEQRVSAILDAAGSGLRQVEADPSLVTGGGGKNPFAQANQLADDYGLNSCGSGGGSSSSGSAGAPTDTGGAAGGSSPSGGSNGTDSNNDGITDPTG